MGQSDCVAKFMRDDVARNVWQRQRKQTVIFDSNQCLVASRLGSSKRNEIAIRQGDDDVTCYPLGALGQLTLAGLALVVMTKVSRGANLIALPITGSVP